MIAEFREFPRKDSVEPRQPLGPLLQKRLDAQVDAIDNSIKLHGAVMSYFYREYFVAITLASGAGVLAAALLLFISATGWQDCPIPLRVGFLGAAAIAALFGSLLTTYGYSKNASANGTSRDALLGLRHQLLTYLVTGEDLAGKQLAPEQMLRYVDSILHDKARLSIGFDETSVRYTDLLDRRP
jgi:hypothetical protein